MRWKNIPGYTHYQASSTGQVRSLDRVEWVTERRRQYWRKRKGRVLLQHLQNTGYFTVMMPDDRSSNVHGQSPVGVHRLVCLAFHGEPPPGKPMALHRNGDPEHNTPGNLYWGSGHDNAADKARHGRTPRGERHHATPLTAADVVVIRARYKPKCRVNGAIALGAEYGVHHTTIENVVARRTWADQP